MSCRKNDLIRKNLYQVFKTICTKKKWEKKANQNEFTNEKVIKKKDHKLYIKCKSCNNLFDSCNYATKADFKNVTDVDTSDFPKRTDWTDLKANVSKLDIEKLKKVPSNEVV